MTRQLPVRHGSSSRRMYVKGLCRFIEAPPEDGKEKISACCGTIDARAENVDANVNVAV
jgi:hypothetical protein